MTRIEIGVEERTPRRNLHWSPYIFLIRLGATYLIQYPTFPLLYNSTLFKISALRRLSGITTIMSIPYGTLNTGQKMPLFGLGTW